MRKGWSKCLPITLWPSADRAAWEEAIRPGNPFEDGGVAGAWSPATRHKTIVGYGRYLFFLKDRNELDETARPNERITPERLTAYVEHLRRVNQGHTIQCRIQELGDTMRALAPESDWSFINRAAARLRATTILVRDKRGLLLPIADVIAHGCQMLKRAEENEALSELGRAALYRDGLVLLFLAHHPMRLRNLSSLRIGHQLIKQGPAFVLNIDASETKTRQSSQQELSERLTFSVRRYIETYRPVLMQAKGRWHTKVLDELWISRDGSPCNPQTLRNIVKKHLVGPNGQRISPHLFRTMAATSVSIEAPSEVDVITVILGHRSYRTGERYYNLAGNLDASRAFSATLDSIRKNLKSAKSPTRPKLKVYSHDPERCSCFTCSYLCSIFFRAPVRYIGR
jgi:integrase/recombinase XerD